MKQRKKSPGRPKKESTRMPIESTEDLQRLIFNLIEEGYKQYKELEKSVRMENPEGKESYIDPKTGEKKYRKKKVRLKTVLSKEDQQMLSEGHKQCSLTIVALIDRATKLDKHFMELNEKKIESFGFKSTLKDELPEVAEVISPMERLLKRG